jgi:hypothetical protein
MTVGVVEIVGVVVGAVFCLVVHMIVRMARLMRMSVCMSV